MRNGWEYKKLGEVCEIKAGFTPKPAELSSVGKYPYYKVADMNTIGNSVYLDKTDSYKTDSKKFFPKGGIAFPKNGAAIATNKKRILKYDSIVDLNTSVALFIPEINEKFAYYWFLDTDFQHYIRGGALPTLDIAGLKEKPFPIIGEECQLAIVSELDKINELIRLKKEQLVEYDNLAQSIFYEMFGDPVENEKGWEVKKLIDVCTKITDGKHGGCTILPESEFFFVGAREITNDSVNYRTAQHISEAEFNKDYARCNVEIGDLLLVNTGATIGKSAIAKDKRSTKTLLQKSVALLKVNKKYLTAPYLQYCYKMNQHMYQVSGASAQANLLLSQIKKTEILLPPLPLQQSFASRIEQIEKLKSEVQNAITDLETLLASRMQYWFE